MAKAKLTGQELRDNANERIKKHREQMSEQGYKTVSILMGRELRAELDHLIESKEITKYQALDFIFDTYRGAGAVPAVVGAGVKPVKPAVVKPVTSNKSGDAQQLNLFNPDQVEIEPADVNAPVAEPANLNTDEHRDLIENFILDRHKKGGRGGNMTLKQIAQALMDAGIKTVNGNEKWVTGNIDRIFRTFISSKG